MALAGDKPWFKSRGVWGAVITLVAAIAGMIGLEISAEEKAELVETLPLIAATVGGLLALVGRVWARSRIGGDKTRLRSSGLAMLVAMGLALLLGGCSLGGLAAGYSAAMERGERHLIEASVEADALYCARYGPEQRAALRERYAAAADADPATAGMRRATRCPGDPEPGEDPEAGAE